MLGIDTKRAPIKGVFADSIREAVRRVSTNNLNEEDKRIIRESVARRKAFHATWK